MHLWIRHNARVSQDVSTNLGAWPSQFALKSRRAATTECPPNRRAEWKHESPDFSRGESQMSLSFCQADRSKKAGSAIVLVGSTAHDTLSPCLCRSRALLFRSYLRENAGREIVSCVTTCAAGTLLFFASTSSPGRIPGELRVSSSPDSAVLSHSTLRTLRAISGTTIAKNTVSPAR